MADKVIKTTYTAEIDKASYQRVQQDLQKQSQLQVKSAKDSQRLTEKQASATKDLVKNQKDYNREQLKAQKAEKTRLQLLDEQNSALRRQVGSVGDVDSALSAIRGGAGAITGTDLAGLEQVAGIFEFGEAIVQLEGALPTAIESVKSLGADTVIGFGAVGLALAGVTLASQHLASENEKVRQSTIALVEAQRTYYQQIEAGDLESTTQSLASAQSELRAESNLLADVTSQIEDRFKATQENGGVLGDAMARLNVAIGSTDPVLQALIEQQKEQQSTVSELTANVAGLKRARDELATSTETLAQAEERRAKEASAQAQKYIDYANETRALREFELQTLQSSTEANEKLLLSLQSDITFAKEQIAITESSGVVTKETTEAIAKYNKEIELAQQKIQFLTSTSIPYTQQLDKEAELKEAQKEASKELEAQEQERLNKEKAIASERDKTLNSLISLSKKANDSLDEYARKQAELTQDRLLRDSRELEDYNAKVAQDTIEHHRDLLDISRDGNKAIAEAQQAVKDFDKEFMQGQIDAQQDYHDDLASLNRKRDLEELQARRDHLADLRDAEQNNDVLAFLQAQNKFKQDQQTRKEDESLEDKERREQLARTLADNRTAYLERRRLLLQEVTERRQALQQSISEARQAFNEEQRLAQQSFELDLQRQIQDDQIADQRSQQALQRTLNEINLKAQAELSAIRQVTSAVGALEAVANRIASTARNAGSGSSSGGYSSNYSSYSSLGSKSYEQGGSVATLTSANQATHSSRIARVAFGNEGYVTKPTQALVGESLKSGEGEAMVKFKLSEGLPASIMRRSGGQSQQPVIHFAPNLTVGDIATGREVTEALQATVNDFTNQLFGSLSRAVNNPVS
jgi:hypothetical protein